MFFCFYRHPVTVNLSTRTALANFIKTITTLVVAMNHDDHPSLQSELNDLAPQLTEL